MWLFIVTFVLFVLWIYKLTSPSARFREYGDKIPGPKSYPFIGSAYVFLTSKCNSNLEVVGTLQKKYGPVFRMWLGNKLIVLLSDPQDLEVFFSSTKFINKPFSYRFLDSWLGDTNLLTGNGDVWRLHRKMLTPSFHFKFLENSVPMIYRNSEVLCDKLEAEASSGGFDIEQYIEKSTLDIICETAMGIKLNSQLAGTSAYLDCIKTISTSLLDRFLSPWLQPEIFFRLSKAGKLYYENLLVIKDQGRKVIQERKKLLDEAKNLNENSDDNDDTGRKKLKPFLDFVLTQGSFDDKEIENEVQTFMFAGHDTTKAAISFCLYTLAHHQDIQEKLALEIRETFSNIHGEPTYQDFLSMKYLELVIKESMRLYAPVPFISRYADEDITLPSGYVIPAGAQADISIFLAHRNEKYFPDPEKFIPERFDTRSDKRNPYAYVPFSAGARNCIGQKFAMLEMKVVLSSLLLKYRFLPDEQAEEIILDSSLVLRSKNKLPVKIKKRI